MIVFRFTVHSKNSLAKKNLLEMPQDLLHPLHRHIMCLLGSFPPMRKTSHGNSCPGDGSSWRNTAWNSCGNLQIYHLLLWTSSVTRLHQLSMPSCLPALMVQIFNSQWFPAGQPMCSLPSDWNDISLVLSVMKWKEKYYFLTKRLHSVVKIFLVENGVWGWKEYIYYHHGSSIDYPGCQRFLALGS